MAKDKQQFWSDVWTALAVALKKISDNGEDEEKLRKIWKFYQRKRNTAGGQAKALAAGILHAYARINFLGSEQKLWRQRNIAALCGVSESTIGAKAKQIFEGLKMEMMDQRFARASVAEKNPMNRMMVNPETGFLFMDDGGLDGLSGVHLRKSKDEYYFDAMDMLNAGDADYAIRLLKKAMEIDEHYLAGFVGLASAYLQKENSAKHRQFVEEGFGEVKKIYPVWPERMEWGVTENRPAMRLICYKAAMEHEAGNLDEADELYRLLLKLNPGDNQGVRYLLAAMFADHKPDYADELTDEGNAKQDWSMLENLLIEQDSKHHFWSPPE